MAGYLPLGFEARVSILPLEVLSAEDRISGLMDILTKVKDPDTLLVEGQVAAAGGDMVRKEVQERSELGTV